MALRVKSPTGSGSRRFVAIAEGCIESGNNVDTVPAYEAAVSLAESAEVDLRARRYDIRRMPKLWLADGVPVLPVMLLLLLSETLRWRESFKLLQPLQEDNAAAFELL